MKINWPHSGHCKNKRQFHQVWRWTDSGRIYGFSHSLVEGVLLLFILWEISGDLRVSLWEILARTDRNGGKSDYPSDPFYATRSLNRVRAWTIIELWWFTCNYLDQHVTSIRVNNYYFPSLQFTQTANSSFYCIAVVSDKPILIHNRRSDSLISILIIHIKVCVNSRIEKGKTRIRSLWVS